MTTLTTDDTDRGGTDMGATGATSTARLFAAWNATQRVDLASHLDCFGAVARPAGRDPHWGDRLLAAVEASGLTGRGGAAFPAARKLALLRSARGAATLVVNATEGEPASAKDRTLLTRAPHLVLDGAELVAAAIGASSVVVCVADDQPAVAAAVSGAVDERRRRGQGHRGGFDAGAVELARPPARFVTGEESSLVSWLARGVAAPAFRPDKSIPLTIGRRPTLVHNAETVAHVALVARYGAEWFRQVGTPDAPGTCLVTVSGAVTHPTVVEVALGTPVRDIVDTCGPTGRVGAVLVGGYGGSWLTPAQAATPFAPRALAELGGTTGAGIIVVLPAGVCGLAETARIARFMAGESVGQCGPCVFGLPAVARDLELVVSGRGDRATLKRLTGRLAAVEGRGACRHPDGVVRMVRSALRTFDDDLQAHAGGRSCAAARRHGEGRTGPVARSGPERSGPERSGPPRSGPPWSGPPWSGPGRLGRGRTAPETGR